MSTTILLRNKDGSYTSFMKYVERPSLPHTLLEDAEDRANIISMMLPVSSEAFKTAMNMLETRKFPCFPLPYYKELLLLSKYINMPLLYHITQIPSAGKIEEYILEHDVPDLLPFLSDFGQNVTRSLCTFKYDTPKLFEALEPSDPQMNRKLVENSLIKVLLHNNLTPFTPSTYFHLVKNNRPLKYFEMVFKHCSDFPSDLASKISDRKDVFAWFLRNKKSHDSLDSPYVLAKASELCDISWVKELIKIGCPTSNLIGDRLCLFRRMQSTNLYPSIREKYMNFIEWCCQEGYISSHASECTDPDVQELLNRYKLSSGSMTPLPSFIPRLVRSTAFYGEV